MKINPVSFGRTIKVNAPLSDAKYLANLINADSVHLDKKEDNSTQSKLQTMFYDREEGEARAVRVYGESYILTGEASKRAKALLEDRQFQLDAAMELYGKSEMYNLVKGAEDDRFEDYMKLLISETKEPVSINIRKNSKEVEPVKNLLGLPRQVIETINLEV